MTTAVRVFWRRLSFQIRGNGFEYSRKRHREPVPDRPAVRPAKRMAVEETSGASMGNATMQPLGVEATLGRGRTPIDFGIAAPLHHREMGQQRKLAARCQERHAKNASLPMIQNQRTQFSTAQFGQGVDGGGSARCGAIARRIQ